MYFLYISKLIFFKFIIIYSFGLVAVNVRLTLAILPPGGSIRPSAMSPDFK